MDDPVTNFSMAPLYPTGVTLTCNPIVAISYIFIYLPVLLLITFGNGFVIFAFMISKELRRPQNYLLVSLAITDLLTGIIALPCLVYCRLIISPLTCLSSTRAYFFIPAITCGGSSVFHLVVIAIDRCLSLMFPLRYPLMMTSGKGTLIIAVIWVYNVCFALLPVAIPTDPEFDDWICNSTDYNKSEVDVIFVVVAAFLPCFFVGMMAIYSCMLYIAFKQIRNHRRLTNGTSNAVVKEAQARFRGIITMATVVGAFGICWLPTSFKIFYENTDGHTPISLLAVQTCCEYMGFVNSSLNPLIYGHFNRQFRAGFKLVLIKLKLTKTESTRLAKNR